MKSEIWKKLSVELERVNYSPIQSYRAGNSTHMCSVTEKKKTNKLLNNNYNGRITCRINFIKL